MKRYSSASLMIHKYLFKGEPEVVFFQSSMGTPLENPGMVPNNFLLPFIHRLLLTSRDEVYSTPLELGQTLTTVRNAGTGNFGFLLFAMFIIRMLPLGTEPPYCEMLKPLTDISEWEPSTQVRNPCWAPRWQPVAAASHLRGHLGISGPFELPDDTRCR